MQKRLSKKKINAMSKNCNLAPSATSCTPEELVSCVLALAQYLVLMPVAR